MDVIRLRAYGKGFRGDPGIKKSSPALTALDAVRGDRYVVATVGV